MSIRKKGGAPMMGLVWTPSTIVVALVVAVLAVLAVRRIATRGLCDCHDHCGDSDSPKSGRGGCHGCSGCGAVECMVADMDKALG